MSESMLALRLQAHCLAMAHDIANYRPDQIRNRLEYITASAEALAELKEEKQ